MFVYDIFAKTILFLFRYLKTERLRFNFHFDSSSFLGKERRNFLVKKVKPDLASEGQIPNSLIAEKQNRKRRSARVTGVTSGTRSLDNLFTI